MEYGVYGSTWWSKKWLDHLLAGASARDIDYAFKYVARGQVQPFTLSDNRVMASVKGPNGGLHNVYLVFPRFEKERADVFVGLLKQQPVELAALANGALNPSIELLVSKSGLELFEACDHVNMNCDCKDALPCRYVISVFLKLAEMMSADPFVLFKLHGLDIAYLKDYKPEPVESDVPSEPTLVRFLPVNNRVAFPRIPMFKFAEWRDYSHILPAMLANCPEFCPAGNFKKSFVDELERCRAFYNHFEKFEQFAQDFGIYHAHTFLMEKERLQLVHARGWQWTFNQLEDEREVATGLAVENVMGALCRLNQDCVWHNHVTVRFVHQLLQVSYYLVRCGAIYPQVFWLNNVTAQVRWLPAEMLPDVLHVVDELEKSVPDDFAFTVRDQVREDLDSAAEHILSVFIGKLLRFARTAQSYKKGTHENLLGFFFDCKSGRLAANGLKIPSKIQAWFSVYNSLEFNHKIIFHCSELGKEIALDVLVESSAGREGLKALFENSDPRLLSLMNVLNCVAETFKPLKAYLERRAVEPLVMHGAELKEFVTYSVKKFEVFGIVTEMPRSLKEMSRPKQQMKLKGSLGIGAFTAGDLLDFDWEVALGDENVSAEEFLRLARDAGGLLKYKDRYIEYTADDLALLQQRLDEHEKKKAPTAAAVDSAENADGNTEGAETVDEELAAENFIPSTAKLLQACLTGKCDEIPVDMTDGLKQQLDSWRGETEVALPENLNAKLRPYQERGYSWMYKNLQMGFGCILADDMGLGKTLQVIAFLLKLKQDGRLNEGRALVVVPAGLLCNWQMEIKKFAPELSVFAYHGASRKLDKFDADLLITTYSTCRLDFKKLEKLNWQVVVIDEAQNIKNADSEQSRRIRAFRAPMKIAMSGTPVENRLMEFWTIMDFCNRGFLPSAAEFRDKYETPIQKNANQAVADRFKKITGPFMLRRMKTDKSIISDLPDKIQQNEYAVLTRSQAALYKRTLDEFMKELQMLEEGASIDVSEDMLAVASDAMGGSVGAAGTAADSSSGTGDSRSLFKRKGLILQMILALKQICNHPRTYLKAGEAKVEDSGKLGMLLDLLRSILDQGEKAIIFTQFREMGELLKETLARELEVDADFYHGGCTQNQRNEMVRKFQENPDVKVLILSLKAAGTGLNLTAASQVIHYDLWWNPAIEAQATDRAFRIGQTKNVQVHRFITKGTFEEKIDALLEAKKAVAQMTVNAGETWLADMDDKQLGEIFALDSASAL